MINKILKTVFKIRAAAIVALIIITTLLIVAYNYSKMKGIDNQSYYKTMLNYYQGNCLAEDNRKIYYRSQTDHYYLYSSNIDGRDRRRLTSDMM